MKKRIIIEIDLTSSSGNPCQIEHKLCEIVEGFKSTFEYEEYNDSNKLVYNDWDDPHTCELTMTMKVEDM